jgi:hypothetical protein
MFVASTIHTNRGAKQFVEDRPIDLSRKPSMPKKRRINLTPDREARAREAARVRELRSAAEEMMERARQAAIEYRRKHFGGHGSHSFATIERRICQALRVSRLEIRSNRRTKEIAFARQAVMYWAVRMTGLSLPEIGRLMGKDHTSVLHGRDVYPAKRKAMGRYVRPLR